MDRIVWFVLWPALAIAGFVEFLSIVFTCGDDAPADYGDREAIEFCRTFREDDSLEVFLPLAVWAIGILVFRRPQQLQWVNMSAVAAAGLVSLSWSGRAEGGAFVVIAAGCAVGLVVLVAALVTRAFARRDEPCAD